MSQPATPTQLSDAQRIAILDKKVAQITDTTYGHRNTVVRREPFSVIVRMANEPIKLSDHLWCLLITIISLGLGLIVWALVIYLKRSESRIRLIRFDVTPTGEITTTKLPPSTVRTES